MLEVRKYIPQVYNESPDFSIFMGILQIALNEIEVKSLILESLPIESILPEKLSNYPVLRDSFRRMIKDKGKINCLLYAITLAGGEVFSLDEEKNYLKSLGDGVEVTSRLESDIFPSVDRNKLVYYLDGGKLFINIKDLSKINQDLLTKLWYYIKPVNLVIILQQANLSVLI